MAPMLEYRVSARRIDAHGSVASTKDAEIVLDTDINGRPDAFNPAELFLAAIAACMIKGITGASISCISTSESSVRSRILQQRH